MLETAPIVGSSAINLALYFLNNYIGDGKKKDIALCSVFTLAGLIGDKLILPMLIMPVLVCCAVKLLKYPIKEVKKYHTVTIKLLEIQAEYVKVTINQFENMGEHGNNDAKLTEIKYNKKIRTLQKEQDKLLKNIINDMKEK